MKYIQKQNSPPDFEKWKTDKKNRQADLAKIKDLTPEKLKLRWDNLKSKKDIYTGYSKENFEVSFSKYFTIQTK